ncbi:hypothetical protein BY458DRAFT_570768 [Sporodiniella umbellata]|nr:hypothetical protein BY458DRAFT_570768 [Sporodiniella umbellata]
MSNVPYTPYDTQNACSLIIINIFESLERVELNQTIQLCVDTHEKHGTPPV